MSQPFYATTALIPKSPDDHFVCAFTWHLLPRDLIKCSCVRAAKSISGFAAVISRCRFRHACRHHAYFLHSARQALSFRLLLRQYASVLSSAHTPSAQWALCRHTFAGKTKVLHFYIKCLPVRARPSRRRQPKASSFTGHRRQRATANFSLNISRHLVSKQVTQPSILLHGDRRFLGS